MGFAKENGLSVVNPSFEEYAHYFQATERDLFCKFPPPFLAIPATSRMRQKLFQFVSRWQGRIVRRKLFPQSISTIDITWDEKCDLSNKRLIKLALSKNLVLCGWRFRDHENFDKYAADIRSYFKPIKPIQQNVMRLIEHCRRECDVLVGVHIRRGDYREFRGGIYHHEDSEYLAAMQKIQQLIPDKTVVFLICSNEPVAEEAFHGCPYRLGTNHLVEDLYALAECDYLIGPPSTFSQWASFYGQVPLYQMASSKELKSLRQFEVADSRCDFPEEFSNCSEVAVN